MSEPKKDLLQENEQVEEIFDNSELPVSDFVANNDAEALQQNVEAERVKLKTLFKKSKKISNFSVLGAVILIIICFIFVSLNNDALKITGYCIGGVALVGMLVFYVINKNKFPNATKEYINIVETMFNAYAFADEQFKEIRTDKDEKIEKGEIASDLVYKDISRIASRNVVHAKFDKQNVVVGDLALYHKGPKNQDLPIFVGKYISVENNIAFDGRIILQIKNLEKEVDTPDCIEDLTVVKEEENFKALASKGIDYKEILGTKLISEIRNIKIEEHLLNVNIVVWGGHTGIYLSFDDATMVFPFENEFSSKPYVQYTKLQLDLLNNLKVLNKEKTIKSKVKKEEVKETEEKSE